jgi:uncharacterized cupredoxin-like copper-binding protein
MVKYLKMLLIPLVLVLVVACGGAEESSDTGDVDGAQTASITVIQNDIYYGSNNDNVANSVVWTVPADARVRVSLENQGALEHNWAVVKMGETIPEVFDSSANGDLLLYDTGLVDAGSTSSETFTAPAEPGRYQVICTIAGHYPSMQGILEVEG